MKRFLACLAALMLALVPVLASAATPTELMTAAQERGEAVTTEIKVTIGQSAAFLLQNLGLKPDLVTGITELLNDLTVKATVFKPARVDLSVNLKDEDVIVMQEELAEDSLWIRTNLFGDDTIAFNAEEYKAFIRKALGDKADSMSQLIDMISFDQSAAMNNLDLSGVELDLSALQDLAMEVLQTAKVEAPVSDVLPEGCAPAAQKISFQLSGEQLQKLLQTLADNVLQVPQIQEYIQALLANQNMTLDDLKENLSKSLEEEIGKAGPLDGTVYLGADGSLVYAVFDYEGAKEEVWYTAEADGKVVNLKMVAGANTIEAAILTESETVIRANVSVMSDGNTTFSLNLNGTSESGETSAKSSGRAEINAAVLTVWVNWNTEAAVQGSTVLNTNVDLGLSMLGDEPLLSLIVKQNSDPAAVAESLVTEDAVRLGLMEEAELNDYMNNKVAPVIQQVLTNVMQKLPASLLQQLVPQQ